MSKFCGNCGAMMEDDVSVCGICGTPFNDEAQSYDNSGYNENSNSIVNSGETAVVQAPLTPNQAKIKKVIIFGAIGIGVIIVLVIVVNIVSSIFANQYKKALDKYFEGINERNFDTYLSGMCQMERDAIEENSKDIEAVDDNFGELIDKGFDAAEDKYDGKLGKDIKLTYEVKDVDDLSERKTEKLLEYADEKLKMDTENATAVKVVNVKIKLKGSKEEKKIGSGKIYVVKDNGEWGVYYTLPKLSEDGYYASYTTGDDGISNGVITDFAEFNQIFSLSIKGISQ